MKTLINLNYLFGCNLIASKEEIRTYLNGVHLFTRDNKLYYEATDGHRLIRASDSELEGIEHEINITIPSGLINTIKKSLPRGTQKHQDFTYDFETREIEIEIGSMRFTDKEPEGIWPDTDRSIKHDPGAVKSIGLNPVYLEEIQKAFWIISGEQRKWCKSYLKLDFSDYKSPIRITYNDSVGDAFAVLMPVRL